MSYFVIDNFGHGLDARRHILNLPPGSLFRAKNCNINRGGEPESAKAFVPTFNLPAGTFGMLAAGGKLFTFGSGGNPGVPDGVTYQQLTIPNGGSMTGVVYATPVKGKPFVIATFTTGYGVFFNGLFITDWGSTGAAAMLKSDGTVGVYATMSDVAINFAGQIQASGIYTAVPSGASVVITGRPGTAFSISATAVDGGTINDQTATVATSQNADPGGGAKGASTIIQLVNVQPEWNDQINMGAGGYVPITFISSLKVNGVELLIHGGLVASDNGGAADALANAINQYVTAPDYTAVSSGGQVTLTAVATGTAANGYNVVVDDGSYWHTNIPAAMSGGSNSVAATSQVSTVTFGGTFENADSFSITLAGVPYTMAASVPPNGGSTGDGSGGGSGGTPTNAIGQRPVAALTKNSKTYAIAGPNLFGSKIGDCTVWNGTGAEGCFITDMSSELAGAEVLTALGLFQGNLAVFSRSTVQIRFVDPDPANNEQLQAMTNIGTMASKSVVAFGDVDLFFLSDTGLRSLKTRTATNAATVSDIGSPIDPLIVAAIHADGNAAARACAALEPVDGRFFLQIGLITYVFNYFPDAKVSGWTTYETGLAITDFAVIDTRFFARAGDVIYLLGGVNNDTYTAQQPDIKIPFLSAKQLGTLKHFTALDVICDGTFDVSICTDPLSPDTEEVISTITGTQINNGSNPFGGEDVAALSLRFLGRPSKYGRVSAIAVHYEALKENAP